MTRSVFIKTDVFPKFEEVSEIELIIDDSRIRLTLEILTCENTSIIDQKVYTAKVIEFEGNAVYHEYFKKGSIIKFLNVKGSLKFQLIIES